MPKLRVLVVDDAVVMRRLITEAIATDPELELAGIAANGKIALARIPQVNPDIVTLDIEMPEMDGITTVTEIRRLYPRLPVVMFSTLSHRGAEITLEALARGATDYVTKPANVGDVREGIRRLHEELIPRLKLHARKALLPVGSGPSRAAAPQPPAIRPARGRPGLVTAVAIGTSTGGPNALADVFARLEVDPLGPPYFLVQHMPPIFTGLLAERLNKMGALPFHEARHDQLVERGHAYIAPGGFHMEVRKVAGVMRIVLHDGPPENSCRPAVDVLFRSVAAAYGPGTLGIILTGMGQDGLRGCRNITEAGGSIVAQDETSSVVWGMPGAVVGAGLADEIVPLSEIAVALTRRTTARLRTPATLTH